MNPRRNDPREQFNLPGNLKDPPPTPSAHNPPPTKKNKMKNLRLTVSTLIAVVGLKSQTISRAQESSSTGMKFHLDLGLTYVNGAYDVNKQLKAGFIDNGYTIQDDYVVPIGLSLNPRLEFANGLGAGLALGPTSVVAVKNNSAGFNAGRDINYIIPVGGFVQYNLFSDKNVSPYIRAGIKYPITGGSYIRSGPIGGFGVIGVEFFKQKRVGFGLEAGYDSSRTTISVGPLGAPRKVTPTGFNASLVIFF
jgi:hypothetical protein